MKKGLFRKGLILGIILLFFGVSFVPNISGKNQKINNLEIEKNILLSTLPRWREGGTPHDPEQSLHPYSIKLRDSPTSVLIESPTEYDPTRGVLFCYRYFSLHKNVVVDLVVALTQNDDFDETAYVVVSHLEYKSAKKKFTENGANMSKVKFINETTNDIWIRDYGPHFIFQNGTIGIVDSHYYRNRSHDNFIPTLIGDDHFIMPTYDIGLYYPGGNFLPGPNRTAFMSTLINTDNPFSEGFNETFIAELFQTYQGIDELHIMPKLPKKVDGTGHIDMWMYIIDEDTVIISEFIPGSNDTAIQITENAVDYMQKLGYTVYRTPAWNAIHLPTFQWTHYTYTNSFIVNNRIFIPTYGESNPKYADNDSQALATFQAAAPDLEIVQINCYPIIWAAGALHCIVMQVPRYTNPEPSVHVIWPDGEEFLVSGTTQTIEWCATDTDNIEIPKINLYYSTDGGKNYDFIDSTTDTGFYDWTVPNVETNMAKIKVVAISADSDEGVGISSDVFRISSSNQSVYDFSTGAGKNKYCYGTQTINWTKINNTLSPVKIEIDQTNYDKLAKSDATGGDNDPKRYRTPRPQKDNESTHIFVFNVSEDPDNIADIEILWEGYSEGCTQIELYVWDWVEGQWGNGKGRFGHNRYMDKLAGNRDGYLKSNIRSDFDHYINKSSGRIQMWFLLYTERDEFRSFHDYISLTVSRISDSPNRPIIDGPTIGKKGESYDFTFNSVDLEDDDVYYFIDWGDGCGEEWNGPHPSGVDFVISHSFPFWKTFTIKAKAKDTYGAESNYAKFEITIPRTRTKFYSLVYWFLERFPMLEKLLGLIRI